MLIKVAATFGDEIGFAETGEAVIAELRPAALAVTNTAATAAAAPATPTLSR